jgi:hypothetical protein
MRRFSQLLLVVGFLAALVLPLSQNLRGIDGADAEAENRTLAAWPTLDGTWISVTAFAPGVDTWFQDHFGYRARLIKWYGLSRYFGLGVSPSTDVLIGKNDWLFYAEDGGLDDFVSATPLPPGEVANWRTTVQRARDWCAKRGIVYQFTIPPDKSEVYPEYFAGSVQRVGTLTRTDQVITATTDLGVVVDVRPALALAKTKERLYHRTDTHWNQRGAFVAYQEMIRALHARLPSIPPPLERSDFEDAVREIPGMDLAGMIGLKRVLREEDLRLTPKATRRYVVVEPPGAYATSGEGRIVTEIPGSTLPRAVMFRDSFTSWLAPFLSEHFSRIVYLWENDFDADEVLKEHADVVIQEIVGRHLYGFIPSPELIPEP